MTRTRRPTPRRRPLLSRFRDGRDRTAYFLPSESGDKNTHFLPDVEVFQAGTYRGRHYSVQDLDDMVRNFDRLKGRVKPTAVIGHEEYQPLTAGGPVYDESSSFRDRYPSLRNTGIPAVGWVTALRRKGNSLHADFDRVPRLVRDLVLAGAYGTVSAEVYHRPPEGCADASGKVLRRVALLGGELPHLKNLKDVAALYSDDQYVEFFSDHGGLRRLAATTIAPADSCEVDAGVDCYACFAEARPMPIPRKSVEDMLKRMNVFTPAMADAAVYPDEALFDQIGFHLENIATEGAGLDDESGEGGGDDTREKVLADVLELDPGQDRDALAVTSDEDLARLRDELEGKAVSVEKHNEGKAMTGEALLAKFSEVMGTFEKKIDTKFSEMDAKIEAKIAEGVKKVDEAGKATEKALADRQAAEHRCQCFAEIDALVARGVLERSDVVDDPKNPGKPGLKTVAASMDWKTPVHSYKDAQGAEVAKTQYDLFMEELRRREPRQEYRLEQGEVEQFADDLAETEKVAKAYFAKRQKDTAASRVN